MGAALPRCKPDRHGPAAHPQQSIDKVLASKECRHHRFVQQTVTRQICKCGSPRQMGVEESLASHLRVNLRLLERPTGRSKQCAKRCSAMLQNMNISVLHRTNDSFSSKLTVTMNESVTMYTNCRNVTPRAMNHTLTIYLVYSVER